MTRVKEAYVRRGFKKNCWVVTDSDHQIVRHEFVAGRMTNVKFNGNTVPIKNLNEDTYGEATGNLIAKTTEDHSRNDKKSAFLFSREIVFTAFVTYSPGRGAFIAQVRPDIPAFIVDSCDVLLLMRDATALCGWIKKPPEAE